MAAIVSTRILRLQAVSPRSVATPLPPGTTIDFSAVTGATKPANNADVTGSNTSAAVGGAQGTKLAGIAAGADVTSANTAAGIAGQGALATLNTVATGQIDTHAVRAGLGGQIYPGSIATGDMGTGAVETANIAIGNITQTIDAYTSGNIALTNGAWTAVQSLTMTTAGGPVALIGSGVLDTIINTICTSTFMAIDRDGVLQITIALNGWGGATYYSTFAGTLVDTPAAGAHTYTLYVLHNAINANMRNRSLFASEMKTES